MHFPPSCCSFLFACLLWYQGKEFCFIKSETFVYMPEKMLGMWEEITWQGVRDGAMVSPLILVFPPCFTDHETNYKSFSSQKGGWLGLPRSALWFFGVITSTQFLSVCSALCPDDWSLSFYRQDSTTKGKAGPTAHAYSFKSHSGVIQAPKPWGNYFLYSLIIVTS